MSRTRSSSGRFRQPSSGDAHRPLSRPSPGDVHRPLSRRVLSRRGGRRGVAIVELAVCLSMLVLLLVGSIYFGRAWMFRLQTGPAARQAAGRLTHADDLPVAALAERVRQAYPTTGGTDVHLTRIGGGPVGSIHDRLVTPDYDLLDQAIASLAPITGQPIPTHRAEVGTTYAPGYLFSERRMANAQIATVGHWIKQDLNGHAAIREAEAALATIAEAF